MVNPVIVSILGEPNSTRGEAIVNLGYANIVNEQIVVNNVNVTRNNTTDSLMNWNWTNQGLRNGSVTTIPIFDGNGDCYGSTAVFWWVVAPDVASPSSVPDIRCIVQGGQVRVYSDVSTFTTVYSDNPIWILMDLLVKSGAWTYADFDIQTFINAAAICARSVNYTAADGSTKSHPLFQTSLVIRQRQSAADYIKGLRTSCRATLVPNSANNGLLQVFIDGTLADQHGSPVTGSNFNTAISSINYAGSPTNGYVAYDFSDTNGTIMRNGGKSSLKITQQPITSTPNALSFSFQDSENEYQTDSITVVDSLDISRAAQEVNANFNVAGISSYDHAQRIGAWWLAKTLRGNPRTDTGGTLHFSWQTNFKALFLQVGQIVRLSSAHDNLSNVLVRLTSVKPSANFETVDLEGDWHEDAWYQDQFGQAGFNTISNPNRGRQNRPPYPWFPNTLAPVNASDPLYSSSTFTFDVAQDFTNDASGNPIANLLIKSKLPVNQFSTVQAPLLRAAFSTSSTGGTLTGDNTYSMCVCGMDADGLYTTPSVVVNVPVATGTDTNTVSLIDITWSDGTVAYALFAGTTPNTMCFQSTGAGTPTSIDLTALSERTWGVPDTEFSKLRVQAKKIKHSGVHGLEITGVTTSTITKAAATWATDQFAGRVVTIIANPDNIAFELPVLNYPIVSNTADTLTVAGNPSADGVSSGDVMVIRTLATSFSDTTIGDSSFENFQYPSGMDVNAEKGNIVRIIAGTGAGQTATVTSNTSTVLTINTPWMITPDATSVFIVEEGTWLEDFKVTPQANTSPDTDTVVQVRVDNFLQTTLLVQLSTLDAQDVPSISRYSVWREVYIYGAQGAGVTTTPPLGWAAALAALPQDVIS